MWVGITNSLRAGVEQKVEKERICPLFVTSLFELGHFISSSSALGLEFYAMGFPGFQHVSSRLWDVLASIN